MIHITLYSKPGCHLCDEMKDVIDEVGTSRPIRLTILNILDDLDTYNRYKNDIPILFFDGREIARHRITRDALLQQLTTKH